jgi:hypothetical protein
MTSTLSALAAREHTNDLLRDAKRRRRETDSTSQGSVSAVELRLARVEEARTVRQLAELDSAAELEGEVLLAVVDGEAVAALSLDDQRVVANPFVPTQDAVKLMRMHADHLFGRRAPRRRWVPRPRFA